MWTDGWWSANASISTGGRLQAAAAGRAVEPYSNTAGPGVSPDRDTKCSHSAGGSGEREQGEDGPHTPWCQWFGCTSFMSLCMYAASASLYVCVCVCVCIQHPCFCVCMCLCMHSVHVSCVYVCMMSISLCMFVSVCVCVCVCVCCVLLAPFLPPPPLPSHLMVPLYCAGKLPITINTFACWRWQLPTAFYQWQRWPVHALVMSSWQQITEAIAHCVFVTSVNTVLNAHRNHQAY